MSVSKNDAAWEKLFDKYHLGEKLRQHSWVEITSTQINEFREARLMTKFDHRSQLPKLFAEHKLAILPTTRGSYVLGQFECYSKFGSDEAEVTSIPVQNFPESLDYKDISSEATAINCAFVAKILHHFTGENELLPTVSGRMSSSAFSFRVDTPNGPFPIRVENAQVEIDGGYEGSKALYLIEAKNYISDDFLVRQLFYPYKLWSPKITKPVCCIFLSYTNGVFHLRQYHFTDPNNYNSLHLLQQRKYVLQESVLNHAVLEALIWQTDIAPEPKIPFPQADSFERVINLGELLRAKEFLSKEDITANYDFDARQTDYYLNAGKYLGLIETGKEEKDGPIGCRLTEAGKRTFQLGLHERQKEFIRLLVCHRVFNLAIRFYLEGKSLPNKETLVEMMRESALYNVNSDSTYFRRASTIGGWLNWLLRQLRD